ncbi:unnamed protein product [Vitrella brassicaformis CCMP3155]|uniref:Uncharacterized protein n=1 Tax=Vitrella brassicaformis (strain CCMP3155) TaxID=1169540 RepID=A0A0G4E8G7_VITBC|nr:unnamed protein product [Vitrella brassicaformis CCMP3155]|eukprot:CEL91771.1 unnamed protein product [Vitrella brassicaformis CCMP3155]
MKGPFFFSESFRRIPPLPPVAFSAFRKGAANFSVLSTTLATSTCGRLTANAAHPLEVSSHAQSAGLVTPPVIVSERFNEFIRHESGNSLTTITLSCPGGRPIGVSEKDGPFPIVRRGNETTVENVPVAQFDELNSTELRHVFGAAFEEPADEVENGSGRNLLRF